MSTSWGVTPKVDFWPPHWCTLRQVQTCMCECSHLQPTHTHLSHTHSSQKGTCVWKSAYQRKKLFAHPTLSSWLLLLYFFFHLTLWLLLPLLAMWWCFHYFLLVFWGITCSNEVLCVPPQSIWFPKHWQSKSSIFASPGKDWSEQSCEGQFHFLPADDLSREIKLEPQFWSGGGCFLWTFCRGQLWRI